MATVVVNGRRISGQLGQTLLDTALAGGIVVPHDCVTGQCNTCRVRIYDGEVNPHETLFNGTVLACLATVSGDAVIEFDEVPAQISLRGTVVSLRDLSPDVAEVVLLLQRRLTYLPGQYVKVRFQGFPPRDYSPTLKADGSGELDELIFNIRRNNNGKVSSQLGGRIRPGSRAQIRGPFGHAYHRLAPGRLVLVSSGVGWTPIWAVARASRLREPNRQIVVVAGARHAGNLYMRPSIEWLRNSGAIATLTCSGGDAPPDVKPGRPTLYLPRLLSTDTVVAAGAPGMVAAVELLSAAGGATCYADPFLPARAPARWGDTMLRGLFRGLHRRDRPS